MVSYASMGGEMPVYTYTSLDDPVAAPGGTLAQGINNQGQIVGYYYDGNGLAHGFIYGGGAWTKLDDPSATNGTFAEGINNKGQIVGYYLDASGQHGFLNSGGAFTTLDDPSATAGTTQAWGLNDLGQIVGGFADSGGKHGFLFNGGTYTSIDAGPSTPEGYSPYGNIGPSFEAIGISTIYHRRCGLSLSGVTSAYSCRGTS
jgi:probable HAF family extracellular repeat protein